MMVSRIAAAGCAAAAMVTMLWGAARPAVAANFFAPASWNVGDLNSTYQQWDFFTASSGNLPDVGYQTNGAISTTSTAGGSPAIATGSGNLYWPSGDHGFSATIYNHGGSSGAGGLPVGSGTHVIVQTSTVLNVDGIYSGSLEIVDDQGGSITGGSNGDALRYSVIEERTISTSMGAATERDEIWEFYLPNFTGDFQVQGNMVVHSSFDELRVDSMIAGSALALTPVPEPATCTLLALGGLLLGMGGLRRRRA